MGEIAKRVDGHVLVVTLRNEAAANAMSRAMVEDLVKTWARVESDTSVRAVVVTAVGDRHFCAGAELGALATPGTMIGQDEEPRYSPGQFGVSKPVVCAVNGVAAAGGLGFVVDADIVVASRNARFVEPHVTVGQVCGYAVLRMARFISRSEAARLALVGRAVDLDAARAHQLGLVNELLETPDDARTRAVELAHLITQNSPAASRRSLELLRAAAHSDDEEKLLARAMESVKEHWAHPDAREGPTAALEGRDPVWSADAAR